MGPATTFVGLTIDANAPVTASLLLKLRARDHISDDEAQILASIVSSTSVVEPHTDLVSHGDRPQHSMILVDGFAARYGLVKNGARQITALHTPGDFMDLHSFLLHKMDHGVTTLTACRIARVPHQKLKELSEQHPHLLRMLWLLTLIDGAIHREWVVALGRRDALQHLAHLLCEITSQLQIVGLAPGSEFLFPVTQIEVADMMGLSSVHVNRVLQELRGIGLISWRGSEVTILDFPRLRDLGQFDDSYLHLNPEPR